jgi:uncharacterized protein
MDKIGRENFLVVFAKQPEEGNVKTRLAKDIGNQAAMQVYEKLLDYTALQARELGGTCCLFLDKGKALPHWAFAQPRLQVAGDLGLKMESAFQEVFETGQAKKVVIIGTDCPELTTGLIAKAFRWLDEVAVVVGPASDGGYYLLGMKTLHVGLFREKPWSQPSLMAETVQEILRLKLTFATLPVLHDLDEIEDLERFPFFIP